MTEPAHAPLAPSSAPHWGPGGCPGSVAMQAAQPPQEPTDETREGDAAHWLLASTLLKLTIPPDAIAPNGVPINDEMREATQEVVTDINDTLLQCKPGDYYQIETRVAAPTMIHPDNWGTPDFFFVQRSNKTLHVTDFKYGHRFVDVFENWQLIDYAACIIESEGITDWHNWTFVFTIAQPRCYVRDVLGGTLREWYCGGEYLAKLIDELRAAAGLASQPTAPCKTGKQCLDCTAAWDCEANLRVGGAVVELIHGQHTAGMDAHSIGLNAKILAAALERGKAILGSLEARGMALAEQGVNVPFHAIEFGEGRTVWQKDKIDTAASLVAMFTEGVVKPGVALPTPRDCMKKHGIDAAVITPYTTKNSGAKKLVRVADDRAAKIFGRR